MKHFFCTLLLLVTLTSFAQSFEPINREKVYEAISNDRLDTYYPKLKARMASYDSTLTPEDYRLIYYGFVFLPSYAAYADVDEDDEEDKEEVINKAFKKKEYEKIIQLCDKVIRENPAALRSYYYKLLALSKLERRDSVFYGTRTHYLSLINAILSSGDGLTSKTAFRVISVSDEYELMYEHFEVAKVLSKTMIGSCDRINITRTTKFPKDVICFDLSEYYSSLNNENTLSNDVEGGHISQQQP